MRIIFLDVDGVLNCALTKDRYKGMMGLDERFIGNLVRLVAQSSIKDETRIVLSSSWRASEDKDGKSIPDHLKYLDERLQARGLEIYDKTPVIRHPNEEYSSHRGLEIMTWLYIHREENIKGIVILDDVVFEDFKKYKLGSFLAKSIYFSRAGGFIEPLVDKALRILDKQIDVKSILQERDFEGGG